MEKFDDYPSLARHKSDLHSCSKDDSDKDNIVYMVDTRNACVDFDAVMSNWCSGALPGEDRTPAGLARSVDALYVGEDVCCCDETLRLIEFKNGNLRERQRPALSNKERQRFKEELLSRVESLLDARAGNIVADKRNSVGWDNYGGFADALHATIEGCVDQELGRAIRDRASSEDSAHSYRLETVKSKATSSALLLQKILHEDVEYIKSSVDLVLVYNPDLNPISDDSCEIANDTDLPSSKALSSLASMVAKNAKRPLDRFGLRQSLGIFFHDVLTCTPQELMEYVI